MANSLISSIASAIAQVENTNPSLNNPGGIMDYNYYKQTGQFRLQQYPTPQAGQDALEALTAKYVAQGNTLDSFFGNYAPYGHGSNDPAVYAQTVSKAIGVPVDVPLNQVGDTSIPTYSVTGWGVAPSDLVVGSNDTGSIDTLNSVLGDGSNPYLPVSASAMGNWGWIALAIVGGILIIKGIGD